MSSKFDYPKIIAELNKLLATLPASPPDPSQLNKLSLKKIKKDILSAITKLKDLSISLDNIKQPPTIFDPFDPHRVGEMIAGALILQPLQPLSTLHKFYGSGVYALYYKGLFDAYLPVSNKNHPIYVGKADPKNIHAKIAEDQGERLAVRLMEHAKSIKLAKNLNIDEFNCRYLVVSSGWQKAAEDHLIGRYRPIWNNEMKICFGFGKHGDDAKTRSNKRSPWDTLHPGRPWAAGNASNDRNARKIKSDIKQHFEQFPPKDN